MHVIRKASARGESRARSLPDLEVAFTIGPLIGRVRMVLLSALDRELESFGVTGMQFAILKHLADGPAETAAELCRLLHYDTGSMTRLLDKLEARRLIRRERSRSDRRLVSLRVTAAGRSLLPRLWDSAGRGVQHMLGGFRAAEISNLRDYLERMIANGEPLRAHEAEEPEER
jgi:MarR family multiple antibiotic resistance transcriptional regulator